MFLLPWRWENASDDELVYSTAQELIKKGERLAKELGLYHPYKYIDYAEGFLDLMAGYGKTTCRTSERPSESTILNESMLEVVLRAGSSN